MKLRPPSMIHVIQGEFAVSDSDDQVLTALLGSCVAACIHDPEAGIGGMNHFLLPEAGANSSEQVIYGAQAMELLINALLRRGADKGRLKAKLFGGGNVLAGLNDIGKNNAEFAMQFLKDERIPCVASSLGGKEARRVRFWPVSGRAKQLLLGETKIVETPERAPKRPAAAPADDLELF